jgi:tetratricopeptide (TPR) repeat protein
MADLLTRLQTALAGRYTIERELGRGGMAIVFLARDERHHRPVALKVLRPELAVTLGGERFLREIEITARLTHPHILPVHDSGEADGLLFYVMPYVEGESLRARLRREGQLPLEDVRQITREVADALTFAHRLGVVHRDVKPENILFQAGHALVADFGIARAVSEAGAERLTGTGIALGTPAYMSPEQASGSVLIDGRSDVYALGCVVYEMLGGEPPHTGVTPQAILARQLSGEIRSLTPIRSAVSPRMDAVIRRALAPTPADRFATPQHFAAALAGRVSLPLMAARWRPSRRVLLGSAGAVVAAIAIWLIAMRLAAPPPETRLGLAIFPFHANGARAETWTESLADFLATALDGTPGVRVADPWTLWRTLRPERNAVAESPDPEQAERLARQAGARRYVLGSISQIGDRLDLTVRIYRAGAPGVASSFMTSSSVDSLPAMIQRVAVEIIGRVWDRQGNPSVPPVERYATRSADALKAYLTAKQAMRRGLIDSANASIERAVALDSTFPLALVEETVIKSWTQALRGELYSGLQPLAERAVRYSDSLDVRSRLRAQAILASIRTDGPKAAEALNRILDRDSTDLEAWAMLAYCHMVYGWQYGKGAADAWAANERVIRLDSTYVPGLLRGAYLAAIANSPDAIRREIRLLQRVDTTSDLVLGSLQGLRALLANDTQFDALVDTIAAGPPVQWISVLRRLRADRPERAEQLLERVRKFAGPGFPWRAVVGAEAQLAVAEGRLHEVDSTLRAGGYRDFQGLDRQLELFFVASSIAGMGDTGITRRAVASLARFIPPESALVHFEDRPAWWVAWTLGAYQATHGDTLRAHRWHDVIGTFPPGGTSEDYRGALQSDLESRLAERRGDRDAAVPLAERAFQLWSIHSDNQWEALPEPGMRFHLAELLRATGRPDSAAALLRSLVPPTTWMGFYTARASYELGELAEDRHEYQEAARRYGAALALWERGGPAVARWRERAVAGLRRVVGERQN